MMGAGKSATGRILGELLDIPFSDSDEVIAGEAGMPVARIFDAEGEAGFRRREKEVMARLLACERLVLAAGGGSILDSGTRGLIARRAASVWLKARAGTLAGRLGAGAGRPLLRGRDLCAQLRGLLAARESFYARADMTLETDSLSPRAAAEAICAWLAR